MKDWFFKGILPMAFIAFLLYVFESAYLIDGRVDWFRLWMIAGMPFGLVHFFIGIIPVNMDVTMSLGIIAIQFIMCGIFGGFIAVWTVIKAVYYFISCPIKGLAGFLS